VVRRFEIFIEIRKSGLKLFGFGNKFYQKEMIMKRSILSGKNFRALILYSEIGGHVLTPFLGMSCSGEANR
jgi:hypothetical protein